MPPFLRSQASKASSSKISVPRSRACKTSRSKSKAHNPMRADSKASKHESPKLVPLPSYSYQRLPKGDIRLLRRVRGATSARPPVYNLETVSLSNEPRYQALSYTWGAPFDTPECHDQYDNVYRTVHVESAGGIARIDIGRNLFEALDDLFNLNPEARLWADALCINQKDDVERAAQVSIMESVYRQSKQVVIWLGAHCPQQQSLEWCLDNAPALSNLHSDKAVVLERTGTSEHLRAYGIEFEEAKPIPWIFERFMAETRWFQRAWIVQEAIAGLQVWVRLGNRLMSWNELVQIHTQVGSLAYMVKTSLVIGVPEPNSILTWLGDIKIIYLRARHSDVSLHSAYDALHMLLEHAVTLQAADPRDRLYFAFGIFSRILADANPICKLPEVSYTITPTSLYFEIALFLLKYYISYRGEVRLFRMLGRAQGHRTGLPSWVPNFNDLEQLCVSDDFAFDEPPWLTDATLSNGPGALEARFTLFGHRHGVISSVVQLSVPAKDIADLLSYQGTLGSEWLTVVVDILTIFYSLPTQFLHGRSRTHVLTRAILRPRSKYYEGDSRLLKLLSWLLFAGLSESECSGAQYDQCCKQLQELRDELVDRQSYDRTCHFDDLTMFESRYYSMALRYWAYADVLNSIYVSTAGDVGYCGANCLAGDEIWVASGLKCPFAFRPVHDSGTHQVISQAYCFDVSVPELRKDIQQSGLIKVTLV